MSFSLFVWPCCIHYANSSICTCGVEESLLILNVLVAAGRLVDEVRLPGVPSVCGGSFESRSHFSTPGLQVPRRLSSVCSPVRSHGAHVQSIDRHYEKMYGSCRVPAPQFDKMVFPDRNNPAKHIVVAHKNNFFKVIVYDNGQPLSTDAIYHQLQEVVNASQEPGPPIGVLTCEDRDAWAKAYQELTADPTNRCSVEDIQKSIFVLCLDGSNRGIEARNAKTKAGLRMIHGGGSRFDSGNRWMDKTLQMIVNPEGEVGITIEHSPAEAVPMAMLMNYCLDFFKKSSSETCSTNLSKIPKPEKLEFCLNSKVENAIEDAKVNIDKLADSVDFALVTFKGYGKNTIKQFKVSPDSFIQIAIQFAFYRLHKEPAAHYESAGLRKFYLGRTECIRSCSCESVNFAKTMLDCKSSVEEKKKALLDAVGAHKQYVAMASNGDGIDRHLLGLKLAAVENGKKPHTFFQDPAFVRSTHFKVTTSQVAGKGDSVMCYGPVVPDGYACCYNPMAEGINFGLAAFKLDKGTNVDDFQDALFESLSDMGEVMSSGLQAKL
ncbi:hypothetical protein C0J52_02637 [Blattella germanica]|nr:hypothetical protein C0J52_02637 [Blattella germanica]